MTITNPDSAAPQRMRVRAWFAKTPIADYLAEPALAARYAASTERRWGLPVTIDPVPGPDADTATATATATGATS